MAINNSKRRTSVITLADKEPEKETKTPKGPGVSDNKKDGSGVDVVTTSDYKVDRNGKKYRAHRIIFNSGEDDGKTGVSEQMKKTFAQLVEVLNKNAAAGKWIDDFVNSDNPKFAGKSKEKRKQMALAAYYAAQQNEELKGGQVNLDKNKNGKLDAQDFKLLRKRNPKEKNMNEELHPEAGKVLKHIKPEHHAKYKDDLAKGIYKGDASDRLAVLRAAQRAGHLVNESTFEWQNTPRKTSDDTKTKTYHDIKKTATGTVYTKQFDKDGISKGTGGDAAAKADNAPKRGRGRPKKDKFAESVEILMSLSEEQFDSMMEEGFDAFFEAYEQLDELSKTTLGSYAKKAAVDAKFKGFDAGSQQGHAMAKSKEMYGGIDAGSKTDELAHKRLRNVKKAIDRLTK